ncbi:MAG TPA: outer membrane beta-barrel family protein [Chitinophaga sp.]|uniref:outer membrane beta-barrel family protein n=1 Tax=Chitinophaga sp. TaxID=1869181 RepID=UPI002DBD084D|nr:outer membrane beta-barrel family protein [Chitinophaga sp.]HEU4552339.1 outer membrane beta-barrel family protein [Chitinophaga sp.]
MKQWYILLAAVLLGHAALYAQIPVMPATGGKPGTGRPGAGGQRQLPQIGHLYGKLVDADTKKPVAYAAVALLKLRDSSVVTGMLTKDNGEFNFENLPFGTFNMRITFMGYGTLYKRVSISPQTIDQDLGNLKLKPNTKLLSTVEVTGQKSAFTMGIDKKVFNVDRNLVSVGGTAQDVLKNVPAVNVDIDGNVTVRNASPTIFVDGKPSTLTLDQIPADAIESVELITNPSAKYDAEGMSGILNIVLKKNKRAGINGMVNAGIGTGNKYNGGGNINVRQGKVNVFANYMINSNRNWGKGTTDRTNFLNGDTSLLHQESNSRSTPLFQFGRIGLDYYLDNRNTISISQNIVDGNFKNYEDLRSTFNQGDSLGSRITNNKFGFRNYTTQLGFKHTFAEPNREWTADFTYNTSKNNRNGDFNTQPLTPAGDPTGKAALQTNHSDGKTTYIVMQTDYTDPIGKTGKLELGLKGTIRNYNSIYNVYDQDTTTGQYIYNNLLSNDYKYKEQIYAGYVNYSGTAGNFGYQGGLRVEQYIYSGEIPSESLKYKPTKARPGFFPSIYLSQKFAHDQELQLNYSRRVTRPTFFQLIPYRDYTDPLNQREGNPNLKPEYTNSMEFSYAKNWKNGNFLGSVYYRNTNNLLSTISEPLGKDTLLTTFVNADKNNSYGVELTAKNTFFDIWDITANVNLYRSEIAVTQDKHEYANSNFSWNAKINSETRLPANFTLQISGNYQAPTIALPNNSGGRGGGFMMVPASAQGTIKGFSSVDIGLKKDFLKKKTASLTLALSDVFNTRQYELNQAAPAFVQDYIRKRESRILRLTFAYRFGKFDAQIFKRKNTKADRENMQNSMQTEPAF